MAKDQDLETVVARLAVRAPESLAAFIVSLAQAAGPVGEHVRSYLLAEERVELLASLQARMASLAPDSDYEWRHRYGQDVGERLNYLLDTIETLILPAATRDAFDLLVGVVEQDGTAMESCGEHYDSVQVAYERAVDLLRRAVHFVPAQEARLVLGRLLAHDLYGARASLTSIIEALASAD